VAYGQALTPAPGGTPQRQSEAGQKDQQDNIRHPSGGQLRLPY
jgi:hypothetical protein